MHAPRYDITQPFALLSSLKVFFSMRVKVLLRMARHKAEHPLKKSS
jgi:hypothetical protein